VADNLFKETNGPALEAVEGVDASIAPLDLTRANDLLFAGNTFHGVTKRTENPVTRRAEENRRAGLGRRSLGRAALRLRGCGRHLRAGRRGDRDGRGGAGPCDASCDGQGRRERAGDQLHWPEPVRGAVYLTARCDT
jgi:hypothetical protein